MQNVILSPVAISDLVDMIATEVELRIKHAPSSTKENQKSPVMDVTDLSNYLPNKPPISTIYGWTHKGQIPHFKIGARLSFRTIEIDEWVAKKRIPTIDEICSNPILTKKRK